MQQQVIIIITTINLKWVWHTNTHKYQLHKVNKLLQQRNTVHFWLQLNNAEIDTQYLRLTAITIP